MVGRTEMFSALNSRGVTEQTNRLGDPWCQVSHEYLFNCLDLFLR